MQAELLGAHNTFALYTHTAIQPAKQTVPILDENYLPYLRKPTRQSASEAHDRQAAESQRPTASGFGEHAKHEWPREHAGVLAHHDDAHRKPSHALVAYSLYPG